MKHLINGHNYDFFCAILGGGSLGWVFKKDNEPGLYQPLHITESDLSKVILEVKNGKFHGPYKSLYSDG